MKKRTPVSQDILRKIRQIQIYTRRLLSGSLVGDTRSALKGTGFEFDQIREYQQGDDVRFIDWRASARTDKILVKQFIEERSRTLLLAVDISASSFFSSSQELRHDILAQVTSALAMVAEYGKDKVGLCLFSDKIEAYIPPGSGKFHVHTIMEAVFGAEPQHKKTNIAIALEHLAQLKRRDAIVFMLSDFIDTNFEKQLGLVGAMYDFIAVRYLDKNEQAVPAVGLVEIEDIETGRHYTVDMRKKGAHSINTHLAERITQQDNLFARYGIDVLDLVNDKHIIGDVIKFFRRRMRY
jgi:hypothetical protein